MEKYGIFCLGWVKFVFKNGVVGLIWIGYICGCFLMIVGKSFWSLFMFYNIERFIILEE